MLGKEQGKKIRESISDYVVFDLETTGISPKTDEVIEISAIKVINGKVVDEFTSLVNPGRSIPSAASNVNGIYDYMVKDCPPFEEVLKSFDDFIGDMVLIGHNIYSFDLKFLYRDARKYWGKIFVNDFVDTLHYSRCVLPKLAHHRLVDLAEYYNISSEGAHRALNDCRMNQLVYEKLKVEEKLLGDDSKCPKCGAFLKIRDGKFGKFWGCTGYPECRFTKNI